MHNFSNMILHIIHAHDCPQRWAGEIERARSPEIDAHNILVHFLYKNISKMSWYTYAQNISRCTCFFFFWRWGSTLFPEKCVHTFLCKVMAILCRTAAQRTANPCYRWKPTVIQKITMHRTHNQLFKSPFALWWSMY